MFRVRPESGCRACIKWLPIGAPILANEILQLNVGRRAPVQAATAAKKLAKSPAWSNPAREWQLTGADSPCIATGMPKKRQFAHAVSMQKGRKKGQKTKFSAGPTGRSRDQHARVANTEATDVLDKLPPPRLLAYCSFSRSALISAGGSNRSGGNLTLCSTEVVVKTRC